MIYCADCLDQLAKLPDGCVDLIYIDPPFNSRAEWELALARVPGPEEACQRQRSLGTAPGHC